jgi:1-acyl-sn-glycerol-3-phosphate acyltransferase
MADAQRSIEHPQALLTGTGPVPFAATWARRVVSVSLYVLLTTLLWLTLPLSLPLAIVVDAIGRRRWASSRALLFFLLYFSCEIVGIAVSFWLWLSRGSWAGPRDPAFLQRNFRLQCWWTRSLRRGAFGLLDLTLDVEGQDACAPAPLLLFVRHCSVADTMLPIMLVSDPHDIVLRWVMKQELLWDPCLDIVGNRLRNCFVSRMPEEGTRDVAAVATLMRDLSDSEGVVIYPEGTRFTPQKRERLLQKAKDRGDTTLIKRIESLRHTLPPRLGGALALLGENPGADAVFCAHSGFEDLGTLWDLLAGRAIGKTIRISLWRVPYAEIPTKTGEQVAWLHAQWERIDRFVADA